MADSKKFSLRAARVNADLKQTEASEKLGIAPKTLIGYERGYRSPTIDVVMKMCELYNVGIDQLNFLPRDAN